MNMNQLIKNAFDGVQKLKVVTLCIVLAVSFSSCSERGETSGKVTENVTGTVIGSYANGWAELLVQVDKKYPIGKLIEYVGIQDNCMHLPKDGTYLNVIAVQPNLPLSDFPENETLINKRISFSYRVFSWDVEDDVALFIFGAGNALCQPPFVPHYVITKCQIIK